jgi:glutamyl-Q tRNA(Asp) synthetase
MTRPVFRFAPSPNGRLHLGHAYSALLNARMAKEAGGRLLLRIEDTDQTRCKPEFTMGIYEDLAWLGIGWETPVRVQSEHLGDYHDNLWKLWSMGAAYPCFCSRKTALANGLPALDPDGVPLYGGTCRAVPRSEAESRIALRAIHGWRLDMNVCGDSSAAAWGDVVIAKRSSVRCITSQSSPMMQRRGVTHVVRGMDIEAATPIHKLLQRLLGLPSAALSSSPAVARR